MDLTVCFNCKHYVSYREDYEDELEPDDCGFCKYKGGLQHTDGEDTCENFDKLV